MRKSLGIGILIIGILALGLWARADHAKRMEARILTETQQGIDAFGVDLSATVSGRDISVSGSAASAAEKAAVLTALNNVNGARRVTEDIALGNVVSPFRFSGKKQGTELSFDGNSPQGGTFADLIGPLDANLTVADGMPDETWPQFVWIGVKMLNFLENGELEITDRKLTLSGEAISLNTQANIRTLAQNIPSQYNVNLDIFTEPTVPYVFNAAKTGQEIKISGYVPDEETRGIFADFMGTTVADGLELEAGMPDRNWPKVAQTGFEALKGLDEGSIKLSGTTLQATGTASGPKVRQEFETAFNNLPDGYTFSSDIDLGPVSPFTLSAAKQSGGYSAEGYVPDANTRALLAAQIGTDAADTLAIRRGVPDENWADFASRGLQALSKLKSGKISISDKTMKIAGAAATPEISANTRALLADLPNGYDIDLDMDVLDDGRPIGIVVNYARDKGIRVNGKAPMGVSANDMAAALGQQSVAGQITNSGIEADADMLASLKTIGSILPDLDTMKLQISNSNAALDADILPSGNLADIEGKLRSQFGDTLALNLQQIPAEGAQRQNSDGKKEEYRNGVWVALAEPEPEPEPEPEVVAPVEPAQPEIIAPEPTAPTVAQSDNETNADTSTTETTTDETAPEPAKVETVFVPSATVCDQRSGKILAGKKIKFLSGSADLDPTSISLIDELATVMSKCVGIDGITLEIGGHTDAQGSADLNAKLSLQRATSVGIALVNRGVLPSGIIAKGYGETAPIATNDTAEGRAANRRTTFKWE